MADVPSTRSQHSAKAAREAFVAFFESKQHKFWRSSKVVPFNDPTLLFVNAGMCQYKPLFLGDADRKTEFGQLRRACNSQKCIRAGGKHNDLEDVGKDVYHHTFFEMLGNWSFGDYFKAEAVEMAWECLTKVYRLDPARLYATYFGGDTAAGLEPDVVARDLWLKYLPASHVLAGNLKDNFWEMGDTGPCGPCSELHYDRIGGRECPERVNQDDPDVLEIWNLVFMQFNRETGGKLSTLPSPCVDTGMGLERLVSVLNDVRSNYDTDLFQPLFEAIARVCPDRPRDYEGKVGIEDADRVDLAYRAIADHARALSVAIADGAVPSNEGRGYVVRRILRRAVRYGRQILKAPKDQSWLSELVPTVVESLGEAFPELIEEQEKIKAIISSEEAQFSKTLDRGTSLFLKATKKLNPGDKLSGEVAFELLATYGFPVDLTEVMCEEKNLKLDMKEFNEAMERHHSASEGNNASRKLVQHLTPEQIGVLHTTFGVEPTDEALKYSWNPDEGTGLPDLQPLEVEIKAIFDGKDFVQTPVSSESQSDELFVVFDRTNFYAESGGQVGDTGFAQSVIIEEAAATPAKQQDDNNANVDLVITDTKKIGGYVLHVARLNAGTIQVGQQLRLSCDYAVRGKSAKNHTATHLLNCCLREVLGADCNQAGSVVDPNRLRFDFTVQRAVTQEELARVESMMKAHIEAAVDVHVDEVSLASAQSVKGVRCMFGENYPDPVRVVSCGPSICELLRDASPEGAEHISVEFCGGTHLNNTRAIGSFVIVNEEAIARGIRRLTAVTGDAAATVQNNSNILQSRVNDLNAKGAAYVTKNDITVLKDEINSRKDQLSLLARREMIECLDKLTQEKARIGKQLAKDRKTVAATKGKEAACLVEQGGYKWSVVVESALGGDMKAMEEYVAQFLAVLPETPILLLSVDPETSVASVISKVPKGTLNAVEWIQAAAEGMVCKSGGKPNSARGTIAQGSGYDRDVWIRQAFDFATMRSNQI